MEVVKAPNSKLRIKTKPVKKITKELLQTIKEMVQTTESFKDPEGVGLASTQVGLDQRFFVAKSGKSFIVCFNPQILSTSGTKKVFFEGCLSIPDYYGEVQRPTIVTVTYENEQGKKVTRTLRGLAAWVFQHEMDHLNGKLFVDRVLEQKGRMFKSLGKDKNGSEEFEEVKLV